MSLAPTDQRDLIAPLFSGLLEQPPWQEFLRRLIARTGAERAGMQLRGPGGARLDCWGEAFAVSRTVRAARAELEDDSANVGLRPLRVYTYDEVAQANAAAGRVPAERLAAAAIAHGRFMRIPAERGWDAWLALDHSTRDFSAADSALLSGLGPFIAAAIALLLELDSRQHRAEIAEGALAMIGVSQALIDRDRRVVTTDAGHLGDHAVRVGAMLQLPGARGAELARGTARLASGAASHAVVVDPASPERSLLLRRQPAGKALVTLADPLVALTRAEHPAASSGPGQAMAATLAALHGLSPREADLAIALARGEELVPAGARLGLTPETTRNYSKRIYAKTDTRGQADLVRLVLSGIAPFAAEA